jgi:hypothetical protein
VSELVMRERLPLALADLRSFGIVAAPSVSGSITEATAFMDAEAARRAPFARRDNVFWLEADDAAAFDAAGEFTGALRLHIGNPDLVQGIDPGEIIETVHARRPPMIPASAGLALPLTP